MEGGLEVCEGQRTWSAEEHGVLRIFGAEFRHGLVHGDEASVGDGACKDGMGAQVTFSDDEGTGGAVDAVRADESVGDCGCAVFEVEDDVLVFVVLDGLEALVEVCAFGGHAFDEFVEEMGAVDASHSAWGRLVADHFACMFAFALKKKTRLVSFGEYTIFVS